MAAFCGSWNISITSRMEFLMASLDCAVPKPPVIPPIAGCSLTALGLLAVVVSKILINALDRRGQ